MTATAAQIAFRYRPQDSATGVTRATPKRLAEVLGVDEAGTHGWRHRLVSLP